MKQRWRLCGVIISAGMYLGISVEPVMAADASHVPSVGYMDPFGGWYLTSLFPRFRATFDKAGLAVGSVEVKGVASESGVWDLVRRFHVLILSDWDLADRYPGAFRRYLEAGGGVLVVTPYSGLRDRQDLMETTPGTLRWLGIAPQCTACRTLRPTSVLTGGRGEPVGTR